MWYLKKIIAWLLVFAILTFSLCAPAFAAADPVPTDSRGTFYDWAMRPGGSFGGDDREHFGGGRPKYDEWVSDLPAPGYDSDGALYFVPAHDYTVLGGYNGSFLYRCPHSKSDTAGSGCNVTGDCEKLFYRAWPNSGSSQFWVGSLACYFTFSSPINGYYSVPSPISGSGYYKESVGGSSLELVFSSGYSFSDTTYFDAGESLSCFGSLKFQGGGYYCKISSLEGQFTFPVIKVVPLDSTFQGGDFYNITTRPTTITGGNYGIVGDDNNITTVTNTTQIINEGDNLYYNPATGQTYTITDWTYNYDGRIYNITLDTGDTVSVEYGDENITITENTVNEGDTIVNNYTIYYIIDGSGSGDNPSPTPGPTACPHAWAETSRTDPTCTAPGKTAYTCSKCGETKTETVPALGHDWQAIRTVPTEYDENGTQTQAGYTLYECTRCGEQYKDTDSTGPPGDDVDDGGLLAWLNGLIKHLSDNLSGVVALIKRFFTEIPELFGGFTGFLAAVFPFLPEEITLLLTFGMAALVVVGVIKAIRR